VEEEIITKIINTLKNNGINLYKNNIDGTLLNNENINNWCIEISKNENGTKYKIYFVDQYFTKQYEEEYNNEDEAIIKLLDKYLHFSIMTINERLYISGYMDKYDKLNKMNKKEGEKLLKYFNI
jgi:hypothetical protein